MFYYQALKKIRKEKNVTSHDIAAIVNKSRFTVSRWERGICQPSDADMRIIAQYLGVDVKEFSDLSPLPSKETSLSHDAVDIPFETTGLPKNVIAHIKSLTASCIKYRADNAILDTELLRRITLLKSMPFISYIKDAKLKYVYVNENFVALVKGYNKHTIIGCTASDIFPDKEADKVRELEQKVLATKTKISEEEIFIPGTFKKGIGLITIAPILDGNKNVKELSCFIEDITKRKSDEIFRRDLELFINKINHLIWIGKRDFNGSIRSTFLSERGKEIFGLDGYKLQNGIADGKDNVHPDDREMVEEWENSHNDYKKCNYRIINNGKIQWVANECFRYGDLYYGVATDITEYKELSSRFSHIIKTLNASSDAIRIAKGIGEEKEYIFMNRANKSIYEMPLEKLRNNGELWKDFLHPEDKERVCNAENNTGLLRLNYKLLLPDGRIKYIEERSFREIIDGILYTGTIKRQVSDYSKHSLISREYKNEFISLLKSECPDTCFFCLHNNESLKYIFLSESVTNILGLSKREFTSNRFKWLDRIHPDDVESCKRVMLNEQFPKVYLLRYNHPIEGYIKIFLTSYLSNNHKYRYGYMRRFINVSSPNLDCAISDSIKNSLESLLIYESDNQ